MRQYLGDHWRAWLGGAALGSVAALIASWVPGGSWVGKLLAFDNWVILAWMSFILSLALVLASPYAIRLGHRLRQTVQMQCPPLIYVDVIAIALVFFGITITSLLCFGTMAPPTVSSSMSSFLVGILDILLLWIGVLYSWSQRQKASEASPAYGDALGGDYPDEPIVDDAQDLLGRTTFVDKLYEQIVRLPSPHSFVFGLHAGWGEGKTSVLNLLQHRFKSDPTVIPVVFNPWYLATEAALIQSFYTSIERELQSRYVVVGLHKALSRYRDMLSSGLRSLGFGLELPIRDNPERLRSEIESWVARTGCRLVILIDDIDRLQAAEVLPVFKLAALSARLQNTVFLLSFDQVVISKTLKNTAAMDPAFLEKVIQKPLQLPPAEQRDIDRFLLFSDPEGQQGHRSAVDHLLDDLSINADRRREFDEKIAYFYVAHLKRLFRTIRQVKRYLNSLRATLPPVVDEVDLYDFVLLEVLQVFYSAIYRDIWQNAWFYVPGWATEHMISSPLPAFDAGDKYRQIREHIEALLVNESQADVARAILEQIFFVEVKNAFCQAGYSSHDNVVAAYREEKRLTHPDCFPKYFLSRTPAGEIPDRAVEDLIRGWNDGPEAEVESLVFETLGRFRETGQLGEFMQKLRVFKNFVTPSCVSPIVRAVCQCVPSLSKTPEPLWGSEYGRAESLVVRLIEERADSATIRPLLEEVVHRVPSLPFVISVVLWCHPKPGGQFFRIYEHVDIEALRKLAVSRLHTYYVQGKRDIFAELSEADWGFVLYQWGTDWMTNGGENRAVVQSYVMRLIDDTPAYLGLLLRHFIDRSFGQQDGGFRYNEFPQLYDPKAILERLDRHGGRSLRSPEVGRAADLFRQQYAASQQPQANPERHEQVD